MLTWVHRACAGRAWAGSLGFGHRCRQLLLLGLPEL